MDGTVLDPGRAAAASGGTTIAVVGDGAVGLLGVRAAKTLGAERIIAMSRHESRQRAVLLRGASARRAEGYRAMDQRRAIKTLLRP